MMTSSSSFAAIDTLEVNGRSYTYFRLNALLEQGHTSINKLPFSLRILLENLLRYEDGTSVTRDDILAIADWNPANHPDKEIAFRVARVILQDFTGVPAVVDLAAMRDAVAKLGGDPSLINPLIPVDLVIDHSVQVDHFGSREAISLNIQLEYERNRERYMMLRWGQHAYENFRVVPPGVGIVHQVNLEYLGQTVFTRKDANGDYVAYPDTLVGTDSHTTMINALGIVGWGVGGIEAEAAMLGQPIAMLIPQVVGFKLIGSLSEGATATDLVLRVVEMLRAKGVVGKFVEFFGPGLANLSLPNRATIANMAPEYGATMGFFPVDDETLNYLRFTGRSDEQVALVEAYCKAQGLFRSDDTPEPVFTDTVELDLSTVVPSLAGPKRPQDRIPLDQSKTAFAGAVMDLLAQSGQGAKNNDGSPDSQMCDELGKKVNVTHNGNSYTLHHGSVVIAAITSCTNTSNPQVLIAAGLLAQNAIAKGLTSQPWVKTSLAPGSKVVIRYLEKANLLESLEALNFHLVGFGCTTCIGNSGPLAAPIKSAIDEGNLVACSVLSGNRNFEGRIGPDVRANYLASPPLVVAYALAGRMDIDLMTEALGTDTRGEPVYLRDIWPSNQEVTKSLRLAVQSDMFRSEYANVFEGSAAWKTLPIPEGQVYEWEADSTYIRNPPFFEKMPRKPPAPQDIQGARCIAKLGNSITTDHISPAGSIAVDSPAGQYLLERGVKRGQFNSYGSRRGNHEVMMRGTFANTRLRNQLAPGTEGGWTTYLPTGVVISIYDAAMKYIADDTPLVVFAGTEYGTGSSRDWAAKGTLLLGIKAVVAASYERIHRSNLIGMGVLPLQFKPGVNHESLGLTGHEVIDISGIADGLSAGTELTVTATPEGGGEAVTFSVDCRLDTPAEVDYYVHGGILNYVLRNLAG